MENKKNASFIKEFEIMELNLKIANYLYKNTPYPIWNNVMSYAFRILLCSVIGVDIYIYPKIEVNDIPLILFLSFITVCGIGLLIGRWFDGVFENIDKKQITNRDLNQALQEIKNNGLYNQFILDAIFDRITKPTKPILYSDIKNVYNNIFHEHWKLKQKIEKQKMKQEIECQESKIVQEQKDCIDKFI